MKNKSITEQLIEENQSLKDKITRMETRIAFLEEANDTLNREFAHTQRANEWLVNNKEKER